MGIASMGNEWRVLCGQSVWGSVLGVGRWGETGCLGVRAHVWRAYVGCVLFWCLWGVCVVGGVDVVFRYLWGLHVGRVCGTCGWSVGGREGGGGGGTLRPAELAPPWPVVAFILPISERCSYPPHNTQTHTV